MNDQSLRSVPQPAAHALLYWLLTIMAFVVVVPCFVVPPLDAHAQLLVARQREQAAVDALQQRLQQRSAFSDALRTDPQVNLRLAQRDLGYQAPGRIAHVPPSLAGLNAPSAGLAATNVDLPAANATSQLPAWMQQLYPAHWAATYRNRETRDLVLILGLSVMLIALLLYRRRSTALLPATT